MIDVSSMNVFYVGSDIVNMFEVIGCSEVALTKKRMRMRKMEKYDSNIQSISLLIEFLEGDYSSFRERLFRLGYSAEETEEILEECKRLTNE